MTTNNDEAAEAVEYLRAVFPERAIFDDLVQNGAYGDEEHTIRGDDLASACHHLNVLMQHFGVTRFGGPASV